jgi:serine/threonine-protein kinase
MPQIDAERWGRLRPLLDQALDIAAAGREDFLAGLPASAADLRDDLRRLLAEQAQTKPILAEGAAEYAAPLLQRELIDNAEDTLGLCFGAYRVTRLLGVGGMGVVYLAERADGRFSHQVALKVVQTGIGEDARARFEHERRILARLAHPNIAALHDGGELPDGQAFYTMEYVDGVPITLYCMDARCDVAQRIRLLREVAATLAFAHRNLVVHRDIKPSNILVTDAGQVKLLDFGIAKMIGADPHTDGSPTLTAAAGPMTPDFAAPEQFRREAITVATDVYQFGMLCYRVLTGALPYRADPADPYAWARAVAEDEPVTLARSLAPDSMRSVWGAGADAARIRRQLGRDLDAIVRKCLAKAPSERYGSMDVVCADLDACLENRPVSARRGSRRYRIARFARRHRHGLAGAAAVLVLVAASAQFAWRQMLIAHDQADRAAHESEERTVVTSMLTNLLRVGPASARGTRPISAVQALDQSRERVLSAVQDEPMHRAIASAVFAESYLDLEQAQRARETIEPVRAALTADARLQPELLKLDLLLARAAIMLRDLDLARASLARARVAIAVLSVPADAPQRLALQVAQLRLAMAEVPDPATAVVSAQQLLRDSDRPGLRDTLEFADLLHLNASNVANGGDRGAAVPLSQRTYDIVAAHYGASSPAALSAQRRVIIQDVMAKRRLDTEKLLADQESITRAAFGEDSHEYGEVLDLRCVVAEAAKDYVRAEAACRGALAIHEATLEPTSPTLANAYHNLGDMLMHLERPAEALELYRRALELRLRTLAPTQQQMLSTRLKIAEAQCLTGDYAEARAGFDATIGEFVAQYGKQHPHESVYAARFARCLFAAGRRSEARSVLEQHTLAYAQRPGMTEAYRNEIADVWNSLAN